ncbi:hypothetical protein ACYKDZ_17815 [Stutzerimonas stutzeri]
MSNVHTPGPWSFRGCDGGWAIDFNEDQEQVVDYVYEEADARLIAAAPELLEALEDIANDYAERFDMDSQSTNPGMKVVVENARAALAKARGTPC